MLKHLRRARTYLIVITVFVTSRFFLEAAGVGEVVTSEISLLRLLVVLPIFFGIRLARTGVDNAFELMLGNATFVSVGFALTLLVGFLDRLLGVGTHYGTGNLVNSILLNLILAIVFTAANTVICAVTVRLHENDPAWFQKQTPTIS